MNEKTSIHRIKRLKSITKNFLKKYLSHYPSNNFTKKIKLLLNENIYYDVVTKIEDSCCETYDVHVPEDNEYCANGFFSHNSRIRGQRANFLLADEISSINEDIFNDVVFGFASVSSAPAEKAQQFAQIQLLKSLNMWTAENQRIFQESSRGNQVVLSGTADYTFGHFYKTFKLYRDVIRSQDNPQRLKEILGEKTETGMSSKDCSIIRLPATVLPKGFMDDKIIGAAKAKLNSSIFQKEYDATFPDDSDGFFKMSLIQSCVCPVKPSETEEEINFDPCLHGIPNVKYVMGVDPASEKDRLAIVILECYKSHRRIVYSWSIKRSEHKERVARGIVDENDYYRYCGLKIRELMKKFNIVEIAMDAGGGGIAIEEALASPPPELEDLPVFRKKDPPDEKEPKATDLMQGYHILDMIQFSKADWVSNANHTLKLDFEQKTLLFPYHDQVSEEIAIEEDKQSGRVIIENNKEVRLYDSMTSLIEEIEDLKKEIVSISYSKTAKGRENWDLPKFKGPDGKFIVDAKDRYSALLMANYNARAIMVMDNLPPKKERRSFGGRITEFKTPKKDKGGFYLNKPHWVKNNCDKMGRVNKR